mmetsp:Transcript_23442/g.51467  ORF Transcript_23442/g.51467 Transcript_23442/m.51467 type:complete len:418 (-) Transcript_23442:694-1947(-)
MWGMLVPCPNPTRLRPRTPQSPCFTFLMSRIAAPNNPIMPPGRFPAEPPPLDPAGATATDPTLLRGPAVPTATTDPEATAGLASATAASLGPPPSPSDGLDAGATLALTFNCRGAAVAAAASASAAGCAGPGPSAAAASQAARAAAASIALATRDLPALRGCCLGAASTMLTSASSSSCCSSAAVAAFAAAAPLAPGVALRAAGALLGAGVGSSPLAPSSEAPGAHTMAFLEPFPVLPACNAGEPVASGAGDANLDSALAAALFAAAAITSSAVMALPAAAASPAPVPSLSCCSCPSPSSSSSSPTAFSAAPCELLPLPSLLRSALLRAACTVAAAAPAPARLVTRPMAPSAEVVRRLASCSLGRDAAATATPVPDSRAATPALTLTTLVTLCCSSSSPSSSSLYIPRGRPSCTSRD